MAKIELSLPYVLQNEGGDRYTNIPGDAGGPTKYGITLATLSAWRHHPCTAVDVQNLGEPESQAIYKALFWDMLNLDECTSQGIATALFDVAVNRGVGVGRMYQNKVCLQLGKPLNACDARGFIVALEHIVVQGYLAIVAAHPVDAKFLRGWENRAQRLLTLA